MDLNGQILVESLALAEALWWPVRDPAASWWSAVWTLRWRYPERGMPWRGAGDKATERALTECIRAGWVVRRRAASKTIGALLTDSGLIEARKLIGCHPRADTVVRDEVLRHGPAGTWIPEIAFNDNRGWGDQNAAELKVIDATNVPALVAGLVESNCLLRGQVCYRTTGKARPDVPPETLAAAAPEADPEALAAYHRALREGFAWLAAQTNATVGARGEIGALYLPTMALVSYRDAGGYLPVEPSEGTHDGP